jgi:drug/metabolite transporter superfamily protein YnfA
VPLLTQDDLRRHSRFAWLCVLALIAVIVFLWTAEKHRAAAGTVAALFGCLGLILPPRERMASLPWRVRALPRRLDAAPILATLLSSPGYGVNWFYGANPYDEVVHLLSGALAGAVFGALLAVDGAPRGRARRALLGLGFGLALGIAWEVFEAAAGLIGDRIDTASDIALTAAGGTLAALWWARPAALGATPALRPA